MCSAPLEVLISLLYWGIRGVSFSFFFGLGGRVGVGDGVAMGREGGEGGG